MAATTGLVSPTTLGTTDFTNGSNAFGSDNTYATFSWTASGGLLRLGGFDFDIPASATITNIEWEVEGFYATVGAPETVHDLILSLIYGSNESYFGNNNCDRTVNLTTSDSVYTVANAPSCWYQHQITPYDLNNSDLYARVDISTNGSSNYSIDRVRLRITYSLGNEDFFLDVVSASVSGQFVNMSVGGDTGTSSATMQCDISIFEKCEKSGSAGWTSQIPVAHVKLDGSYTGDGEYLGGGYYKGHNWGEADSSWSASNILVPYNAGYSCSYPVSYVCKEGFDIVTEDDFSQNPNLIATVSSSLTSTLYTEPEPSNPLAWVVWKGKQTIVELFVPYRGNPSQEIELLADTLNERAPFAYVKSSLDWSFTDENTSTASPGFVLATSVLPGLPDVNFEMDHSFDQYFNTTKTIIEWILWATLGIYFIRLGQRMFPNDN